MIELVLPLWVEVLASLLLLAGGGFAMVGAIGLVRLRDFAMRLHAPTKVSSLGIGLLLIASMLITTFGAGRVAVHELMITLFVFMTAPVAAHLLVRAALKLNPELRPPTVGADLTAPTATGAAQSPNHPAPDDRDTRG
jgi:multicomponent K+:H+ antiporter subunit G